VKKIIKKKKKKPCNLTTSTVASPYRVTLKNSESKPNTMHGSITEQGSSYVEKPSENHQAWKPVTVQSRPNSIITTRSAFNSHEPICPSVITSETGIGAKNNDIR
jgi:hypothetical protein